MSNILTQARQHKEVFPLLAILSGAVIMAGGVILHKVQNDSEIVWRHTSNPYPWQASQDREQALLLEQTRRSNQQQQN